MQSYEHNQTRLYHIPVGTALEFQEEEGQGGGGGGGAISMSVSLRTTVPLYTATDMYQ